MSRRPREELSGAQREIMELVWERGEVTVSDVWEVLSSRREVARNTVQTLMARMEDKGWLRHRTLGRLFLYEAALPRRASLGRAVGQLVDSLFEGSAEALVSSLLEDRSLSAGEAERIRRLIDEAEDRGQPVTDAGSSRNSRSRRRRAD